MIYHDRRAYLYQITGLGNRLITSKIYSHVSPSHDLQVAYDLADRFNYRQGDGFVAVVDGEGNVVSKIELAP